MPMKILIKDFKEFLTLRQKFPLKLKGTRLARVNLSLLWRIINVFILDFFVQKFAQFSPSD